MGQHWEIYQSSPGRYLPARGCLQPVQYLRHARQQNTLTNAATIETQEIQVNKTGNFSGLAPYPNYQMKQLSLVKIWS